ncbi:unnamed protein product [Chondrus crispus]|uniref:Uncharacterized protein n=1 Tax=Chondrus crispus TaxID=2769 RepID=R7QG29_CHOCR|nr:unnamed protein product [Chondrus crispus]CDF36380.1 unnamed protein product [Chondrus crispus]|eukprot:XP_005716199.1 unnamed protein product [Chondrus crispus]
MNERVSIGSKGNAEREGASDLGECRIGAASRPFKRGKHPQENRGHHQHQGVLRKRQLIRCRDCDGCVTGLSLLPSSLHDCVATDCAVAW